MADSLLILALPSFCSLWLFPMSMLSFSSKCWLRSWASQDLAQPFPQRVLMNAPWASCMTRAMHGVWFLNAGHSIPKASRVDCSSQVSQWFKWMLLVIIPRNWRSVSSNNQELGPNLRLALLQYIDSSTIILNYLLKWEHNRLSTSLKASCTSHNAQVGSV